MSIVSRVFSGCRRVIAHIFSDFQVLASIRHEAWAEALIEVLINSFFAAVPLMLGVAYYVYFEHKGLHASSLSVVQQGELALMSASGLGPILYLVFRKRKGRFPLSLLFGFLCVVLALFGAFAFIHGKVASGSPDHQIIKISAGIFAFTLLLTFFATAIDNAYPDVAESKRQDEEDFSKKFDQQHGQQS